MEGGIGALTALCGSVLLQGFPPMVALRRGWFAASRLYAFDGF